ncbi:hypothetical protein M0R45_037729 [Rubus argutus]|uniref:Uncharacterized protein n=1 Tax=Rubus argutus TaxID=59490 RepID=A0AAW1W5A1_RUBAR
MQLRSSSDASTPPPAAAPSTTGLATARTTSRASRTLLIILRSLRTSFTFGEATGESLLFSFACAQVMYAFVMRPESLPKSLS